MKLVSVEKSPCNNIIGSFSPFFKSMTTLISASHDKTRIRL